jgi:hypothetical protein
MRLIAACLVLCVLPAASVFAAKPKNLVANGGMEQLDQYEFPANWIRKQHAGVGAYHFVASKKQFNKGKRSLMVRRHQEQVWGKAEQNIPAHDLIGATVELTISLRGRKLGDMGAKGFLNAFENGMYLVGESTPALVGNSDWQTYTLKLTVPEYTTILNVGVVLEDAGTVWMDDVTLRVITPAPK